MKKSAKRANYIQLYRQQLRQELDSMGYPGGKQAESTAELTDNDPLAQFDAWDNVHAASDCWNSHDPSSLARRA